MARHHTQKAVLIGDTAYHSQELAAVAVGCHFSTINKRIFNPRWPEYQRYTGRPVIVAGGVPYESMAAVVDELGVSRSTVSRRIKSAKWSDWMVLDAVLEETE